MPRVILNSKILKSGIESTVSKLDNYFTQHLSPASDTSFNKGTFTGDVLVTSNTASTSNITGSLVVSGGVGVSGDIRANNVYSGGILVSPSYSAGTNININNHTISVINNPFFTGVLNISIITDIKYSFFHRST